MCKNLLFCKIFHTGDIFRQKRPKADMNIFYFGPPLFILRFLWNKHMFIHIRCQKHRENKAPKTQEGQNKPGTLYYLRTQSSTVFEGLILLLTPRPSAAQFSPSILAYAGNRPRRRTALQNHQRTSSPLKRHRGKWARTKTNCDRCKCCGLSN